MSTERLIIDLGEKPTVPIFVRQENGIWEHLSFNADEPEEGSERYSWSEENYLDAVDYEKLLPDEAVVASDLKGIDGGPAVPVAVRISDGTTKASKDANCGRILDIMSIYLRQWYYQLQTKKMTAPTARSRIEYLKELRLPLSFTTLLDRSQRQVPKLTSFVSTADYNKFMKAVGNNFKQPRTDKSDLIEWEQHLLSTINTLSKAYTCAAHAAETRNHRDEEIRERLNIVKRGKRQASSRFSCETLGKMLLENNSKFALTDEEKFTTAHLTSVNPADFNLRDEVLRYHYELVILAAEIGYGEQIMCITEPAVRLLMTWEQNEAVFKKLDDTLFKKDIWTMLMKGSAPDQFKSGHIWQMASRLGVQNIMKYLTGEDLKTSSNIQVL